MASVQSVLLEARTQIRKQRFWLSACLPGVVGLLLGVLLVVQLHTQTAIRRATSAAEPEPMVVLSTLVEVNRRLRQERTDLEARVAEYQKVSGQERLTSLVEELKRLRMVNGLMEMTGPGVEVQIGGPVAALEMQDLVNELRNAGAEAIALNGQRLVASSVIASTGDALVLDGQPLTRPYTFQAIGDSHNIETALTRQGGLITLLAQAQEGQKPKVTRQVQMVLPLYTQPLQLQYAEPIE